MRAEYNQLPWRIRSSRKGLLSFIFCLIQILNTIGYITNSSGISSIFSIVSQLYIVLVYGAFFVYLFLERKYRNVSESVLLLIFMVFSAAVSYVINPGSGGLYNFIVLLSGYISLPMYMIFVKDIPAKRTVINCTYVMAVITAIYFVFCGFFTPDYVVGTNALSMGFFNSNQAGIFLVQNFSVLFAFFSIKKKRTTRICILILCAIEFWLIFLTQSRTAVFCVLVLLAGYLLRKRPVAQIVPRILFVAPFAAIFIMIWISNNDFINSIEVFGKPLINARDMIYYNSLQNLQHNYLFGNYASGIFSNLHNAYLSVLLTVGVVGFSLFLLFFWEQTKQFERVHHRNEVTHMAFLGILTLYLNGCVEAAMMVSGSMYAAATAQLLLLMNYEEYT